MGLLAGVTTNPSLMSKESGVTYRDRVVEICEAVNGPVSAECVARDIEGLVAEGREIATWHEHVVVKVPIDEAGLEATSVLSREGIKINMTLVFSANQALLAATAGATYVSPFVGRIDDAGQDGMEVVRESVDIFDRYHLPAQVLAASLRHPRHVTEAAKAGAPIATLPYSVLKAMVRHPLTDVGIERFLADSKKYQREPQRQPTQS
jgi:transaldolase